jgi:hypothetical protein
MLSSKFWRKVQRRVKQLQTIVQRNVMTWGIILYVCRNSRVAANSGQNPRFNFLHEYQDDDPVVVIAIKKLLVKFPQTYTQILASKLNFFL